MRRQHLPPTLLLGFLVLLFWLIRPESYLLFIGLITAAVFAIDKSAAIRHRRRIPEWTLFMLSFLGGAPFAVMTMFLLHHKTSKPQVFLPIFLFAILQVTTLFFLT